MPRSAALSRIEAAAVAALDRGDERAVHPTVLRFLLRVYAFDESSDVGARLESALGVAVERYADTASTLERARWLTLFIDVCSVADDPRVRSAVEGLSELLAGEWPRVGDLDSASASIEACLRAAEAPRSRRLLSAAIDELERVVGQAYRPGHGLATVAEHVHLASALLIAFAITARIPYAMLAEELVQVARRKWWRTPEGAFDASFEDNCDAAGVLRRLAALHRDREYIAAAVVSAGADYDGDADRILSFLESQLPAADVVRSAAFGLTLLDR